jgi:phospholipid/cholesterol/gamma-HCH transport system substrate-binding protein
MAREIGRWRALLNATLVLGVLGLGGFGVVQVSRRHWQWQETFRARAEFATIAGVQVGDKVRVQGIEAGAVEAIVPPSKPGGPVALVLRLDARLRPLVRADATARIAAQGVVGAKVVEVVPGEPDAPPLAEGASLRSEPPIELADMLREARGSLRRLDAVTKAAEAGLGEVNAIAAAVSKGEGSLGKLVRDDEAYRALVSLSSRGERTLNDLDENLAALKRTWPLSRYFNSRGFNDRDRVLFQPGSDRESRILRGDDLFEPGRAVLTDRGRRQLDDWAAWFKRSRRPKATEVVIAAFTDTPPGDDDLALALTQEQAEAVRKYLTSRHAIDSVGWFGSRKVAAVGFGTETPRALAARGAPRDQPARRVEIILFTPQT